VREIKEREKEKAHEFEWKTYERLSIGRGCRGRVFLAFVACCPTYVKVDV